LTLERALSLAAEHNETVLSAEARAEAAKARVARARAFFVPSLTVTGSYTHRQEESERQRRDPLGGQAIARITLFDARGIPLYQAARREGEAEALDAAETRRQLTFQTAEAFLSTLSAQHVAEAAERRLTLARQTLEESRALARKELVSSNHVTRAELEVANAEAQLAQAQGQAQTSRLELGYLLVTPVEGPLAEPEALLTEASQPVDSFAGLAENAEERRMDILSARLQVKAQEARAREPLARLFPVLGASAQYRFTNERGFGGFGGGASLSVDLTWNLFDGGERYAERRERLALARVLTLDATARTRRVDVAVERANVALRTAQAALDRSELAVKAARQNAQETGILYREGLTSSLAVSDALLRQFEAEVALARARYALGSALLELRAAVGLDPLGKEL
jgi:outer membrane protein TolC